MIIIQTSWRKTFWIYFGISDNLLYQCYIEICLYCFLFDSECQYFLFGCIAIRKSIIYCTALHTFKHLVPLENKTYRLQHASKYNKVNFQCTLSNKIKNKKKIKCTLIDTFKQTAQSCSMLTITCKN